MSASESDAVVIRTGLLHEADMAAAAFEEAGIPYYRRTENSAGIQLAMPALPAQGLGQSFLILVPSAAAMQARNVIRNLPIMPTEEAGLWGFRPTEKVKKGFRLYAWIALGVLLASGLAAIINVLKTLAASR